MNGIRLSKTIEKKYSYIILKFPDEKHFTQLWVNTVLDY